MSAAPPLPAPMALAGQGAVALSRYGAALLQALPAPAVVDASAGRRLVEALAQLALAVQAAHPATLRRQTGWWGRLLGRDIERQLDADALQPRLGALLLQAQSCADTLAAQLGVREQTIAEAAQAAGALEAWADAGRDQLPTLPEALRGVLVPRLDHLHRLAALQRIEAGQQHLLQAQDAALLARFQQIAEVLLPAWRQTVLARQAGDHAQRNQQAVELQARIAAEVAAAQARLP